MKKEIIINLMIPAAIAVMLILLSLRTCSTRKDAKVMPDSVQYYKNELGQEVAKREILELDVSELRQLSGHKDELIQRLVNDLKEKGVTSVTGVDMITKFDTIVRTTVVRDSVPCDPNPIYKPELVNDWIDLKVTAKNDSSAFDLVVKNKVNFSVKEEKKRTLVEVTQLNPYSHTSDLQSISLKKKKPNKGLKIAALVVVFISGILISK